MMFMMKFENLEQDISELKNKLDTVLAENPSSPLDISIEKGRNGLIARQHKNDGHWCYELEADCTIPAEYIMMMHFTGDIDEPLQQKIARYIRERQNDEGGWPLYLGGKTDISCTVKAYYALKMAGDEIDEPHMLKATRTVLEKGGAAKCNVFTRIALAMFKQVPWRAAPFIPVEIMHMPKWFPFHVSKVSYWSRTVMVPLFILCSLKATAKNPKQVHIKELFTIDPDKERNYHPVRSSLNRIILFLERIGFNLEPLIPKFVRKSAIRKAEYWFIERLNGLSGLGAIFPAMVNAYEALLLLGYKKDHHLVKTAREAIDNLLVVNKNDAYCQPCVSPVWDTLLASAALQEVGDSIAEESASKGLEWLISKQVLEGNADWRDYQPDVKPGGWAFQYDNDYYPDLDDTGFAAFVLHRSGDERYKENIKRAADWLVGLQSKNGGFAAFDADNTYYYLNEIPFADHGALLDPPTADVSARCLMFLAAIVNQYPEYQESIDRCVEYLTIEQENDGSWFGRWGTNYIYGTWSVLIAFEQIGIGNEDQRVRKAVDWLKSKQWKNGGWGEDNDTYENYNFSGVGYKSNAFQTSWALLALLAAGEAQSEAVEKGIEYLMENQSSDGLWYDPEFTAPGFPKVFYLKYHGYDKYFPLWALARYRREKAYK